MCPVVNWVISEGAGAEQEMEGTCQEKKTGCKNRVSLSLRLARWGITKVSRNLNEQKLGKVVGLKSDCG